MNALAFGILVGGQGSRLGGVAKGLLQKPDGTHLVEHLTAQCRRAAPEAPVYLLGDREEYRALGRPILRDDPTGVGPLGGLNALLQQGHGEVVLLGCDLPFLDSTLLTRLLAEPITTAIAATRGQPARWEPMLSRYRVGETRDAVAEQLRAGRYGIVSLLERLGAKTLHLSDPESPQLDDWDTPEDVAAGGERRSTASAFRTP